MELENFDFSADVWKKPSAPVIDNAAVKAAKETAGAKVEKSQRNKRRLAACVEISEKFLYRRAWGEKQLFDVLAGELPKDGQAFHVLTNGDVDALSFFMYLQTHHVKVKHLILSTWVIAAEDILYLTEQCEAGNIEKIDTYVGEIFPNQYRVEWKMLTDFYGSGTSAAGRLGHFKNHAKIIACEYERDGETCYYIVETSANINTNPRNEFTLLSGNRELWQFYLEFFNGINSFKDRLTDDNLLAKAIKK